MSSLESITAAAKLRHEAAEVQRDLEAKRAEHLRRMTAVKQEEQQLEEERSQLQDTLVQYYKFIQENEIKKNRALKKANAEAKVRDEWQHEIDDLTEKLRQSEQEKEQLRLRFLRLVKYQQYLEEVLIYNENEDFQDPRDIAAHWDTLKNNTLVLQKRKNELEEELLRSKNLLTQKRQQRNYESVELQNQLNELQAMYETLQKTFKVKQDELERCINQKVTTTRTVCHLEMATQNLFDRCVAWNEPYGGKVKLDGREADILTQLRVIGECLEDYQIVIKKHQALRRQLAQQQQQQVQDVQ